MTKISDIEDIIAGHFKREPPPEEAAADQGVTMLEMSREKLYNDKHTMRMAELKKIAALQERVVHRLPDGTDEEHKQSKRPHLTVIK